MKNALCWVQAVAVVAIILMTPCAQCHSSLIPGNSDFYTPVSQHSTCGNEDHHCCHSIHCGCGAFVLLSTRGLPTGLAMSEAVLFSDPPQLLSLFPIDIFQPPRTAIA